MKPKTIYILRHGQSLGNVDWRYYTKMLDEAIPLTPEGERQSAYAGAHLQLEIKTPTVAVYCSHFLRARQTLERICRFLGKKVTFERIDTDLRELLWCSGDYKPDIKMQNIAREVMKAFDGVNPGGESARDVYHRMDDVIRRFEQDFKRPDFPETAVIVTHGIAMKCLLMKWLQWPTDVYEKLGDPNNCQIFKMVLKNDKYYLTTPFPIK